ncbi:MAG TPA: hypothetical protein VNX46_07985, partial [Candidatus Acidoferrum sp.]|nr:hypothetical protein [Candidatus Acidoferrum sp.]
MKTIKSAAVVLGILIASIGQSFCQTNLRFTGTSVTREGAIHLAWSSVSNEVYEIDEADSVIDANIGNTTWNPLYNNYPSQGTNTFWLDTGNYNLNPQILHPKNMPMRFYRVVDQGPDSLLDKPTVLINVLTNNTVVSNEVTFTVTAATDQPGNQGTILYVDGQEMQAADTSTNYTVGSTNYETDTYSLNTCEWFNGPHVIFATTEAASSFSSQINSGPLVTAHAVSPFVTLLFTNLIEEISFSQPSFDPALGETQRISAVFAADCNWTLNIEDIYTNLVFTTNGSGISMSYNWDGNGNGETNLPAGIYFYYITAATNGLTPGVVIGGSSGGSGGTLPSPDSVSGASELWVVSPDSENVVPLALYPPGFDTNGITIFEATPSEVQSLTAAASSAPSSLAMDSSSVSGASPDFASSSGQSSPPSPQRP